VKELACNWVNKGIQTTARRFSDKEINLYFLYHTLNSRGTKISVEKLANLVHVKEKYAIKTVRKLDKFFRYSKQAREIRRSVLSELNN
jgi:hypothetical protein